MKRRSNSKIRSIGQFDHSLVVVVEVVEEVELVLVDDVLVLVVVDVELVLVLDVEVVLVVDVVDVVAEADNDQ